MCIARPSIISELMSCGGSFFILMAACADITRDVRGLCQNSSLDIVQNNGSSAGRCFLGGSGCFCLSCPSLTVIFQLLYMVTARDSKQFPREACLCSMIVRTKYFLPLHLVLEANLPSFRCTMHAFLMLYEKAHQL